MVSTLVCSGQLSLPAWEPFVPSRATKAQSVERQWQRFLVNGRIQVAALYVPLVLVATVFADPPFNIGKHYGSNTDDQRPDDGYLSWCKEWVSECVRILKPGGALFLYNLPKWNILLGAFFAEQGIVFDR